MAKVKFYYLCKETSSDVVLCYCHGSSRSEATFLKALTNSQTEYRVFLPVPESCVIRIYGRANIPTEYHKEWPLPWPK